jgi:hypothetical protein
MGSPAPTTYIVKEEGSDDIMKVVIGLNQTCSCGGGCLTGNTAATSNVSGEESFSNKRNAKERNYGELCIHLIWVMVKVLRAPPTHPLVWQLSLIDSEVDTLLSFKELEQVALKKKKAFLKRGGGRGCAVANSNEEDDGSQCNAEDEYDLFACIPKINILYQEYLIKIKQMV